MGNPPRFTSGGNPPCVRSHASTLQKPRFTPQESFLLVLGAMPPRFRSLAPRLRSHTSSLPEPSLHVTLDWGQQTHTPPDLQISLACPPPSSFLHTWRSIYMDAREASTSGREIRKRNRSTPTRSPCAGVRSPGMVHGCLKGSHGLWLLSWIRSVIRVRFLKAACDDKHSTNVEQLPSYPRHVQRCGFVWTPRRSGNRVVAFEPVPLPTWLQNLIRTGAQGSRPQSEG